MKRLLQIFMTAITAVVMSTTNSWADIEPFVGQIMWVPYTFAPKGWAFCSGQLLPISQNTALFSLLGTQFGGDGRSTFALPNMQGSALLTAGQGIGLSLYQIGESGGAETHTLLASEIPTHSHAVQATNNSATQSTPTGHIWAQSMAGQLYAGSPTASLSATAVQATGGNQPHNNMMPSTTLQCIIALQGIFPSRP